MDKTTFTKMEKKTLKKLIPKIDLIWVIRYWLGIMMIMHSYKTLFDAEMLQGFTGYLAEMNFPIPKTMAILSKLFEFAGGLLLLCGLFTRIAALMIILVMGVATFYVHKALIFGEGEMAFTYFILALILLFKPDIPYTISLFKKQRQL